MLKKLGLISLLFVTLSSCDTTKNTVLQAPEIVEQDKTEMVKRDGLVSDIDEFHSAIESALPGDKIILANGVWTDTELKFAAVGTKDAPIYIIAETKGKVFFEGQSNVKIGGSYIHLEGLVFRNGYTPSSAVISFQKDKNTPCNNCRVTECVIDNYNPSERFDTDYWVEIYGKHNRFDHNYLVGKRNRGVTLAVRLKNERDRENYTRIDHNHFGYHPTLGSNGGETVRIGTSHYSLSNSNTIVEDNYFERCSGELEIISSKSCQNTFRNNTFFECQGTLTMRHGNETIVENNYFFGNRKPNTGGIRVINESQTVRNNYIQGLTGYRFRGALVVMNGVPNSPLNRYFQVKDSEISNNIMVDCDHIQLCAGSDEERSATPVNTTFANNIISNKERENVFTIYDDVSGIDFTNNMLSSNLSMPAYKGKDITKGMSSKDINLSTSTYSYKADDGTTIGIRTDKPKPNANNTGVSWYPKKDYQIRFRTGKTINVAPGENTIFEAIKKADDGDILVLSDGNYHQTRTVTVPNAISIISMTTSHKPTLTFERSPLLALENGGSLELENLNISGSAADDYSGNSVIRTSRYSMINNYKLLVKSCDIVDLNVNHSFNFLRVFKNTFADSILVTNSNFKNITGHVFNLDKEFEDRGIYNAENIVIDNCTFEDIGGSALKLYRGGRDESTFGPILYLTNSDFTNVGHDKRNANESAIHIHGVQYAEMENLNINNSRKIHMHLIVGEPVIKLKDLDLIKSEELYTNSPAYSQENVRVTK